MVFLEKMDKMSILREELKKNINDFMEDIPQTK
jgi:hypothetical protein